jgi:hypothetical protein
MLIPPTVMVTELPALSVAIPKTDWSAPSPDRVELPEYDAKPESPSSTMKVTVTDSLFQPLMFGSGLLEPLIVGGVKSMLTETVNEAELPAKSVTVPVTSWSAPSPVTVVLPEYAFKPESPSETTKSTVTDSLFQPYEMGLGLRKELMSGAVLSMLTETVKVAELPAKSVALPLTNWLAPSPVRVVLPEYEFKPERPSETMNETVTDSLFQPYAFGSGLLEPTIEGGVLSMLTETVKDTELPARSTAVPSTL